jgi:hypothetical protein
LSDWQEFHYFYTPNFTSFLTTLENTKGKDSDRDFSRKFGGIMG